MAHATPELADLRRNYACPPLREADAHASPFDQFQAWFTDAKSAGVKEPNAMTLATASADGAPSARIVLLKGLSDEGFVFFTNHDSQKGRELDANPRAELVWYWDVLDRQVRVAGAVRRLDRDAVTRYFQSRPKGSQLGAWASRQSRPAESREAVQAAYDQLSQEHKNTDSPLDPPPDWGGYVVAPKKIEFWQGQPSRLHDRLVYRRDETNDSVWTIERLQP